MFMGLFCRDRLFQYVEEHQASILETWQDCYTLLLTADEQQIRAGLLRQLHQRGMTTQFPAKDNRLIYSEYMTEARHTLLFFTSANPTWSIFQQATAITACLAAIDTYQADQASLPINIKWLVHLGSHKALHISLHASLTTAPTLLEADGCLWYTAGEDVSCEPHSPQLALGAKGLLCVECEVHVAQREMASSYGGIVPNAAWRLLWALSSLKNVHEDILIEGFYDRVDPFTDDVTLLLSALPDAAPMLAQQWGMKQLLFKLHGYQQHYVHFLTPTCTVNLFNTYNGASADHVSSKELFIPIHAKASLDFHLVPEQDPQDIFARLQDHLHVQGFSDIHMRQLYACPPTYTPPTAPFVQMVQQAASIAYTQAPLIFPLVASHAPLAPLQRILGMPVVIVIIDAPAQAMQVAEIIPEEYMLSRLTNLMIALIEDSAPLSQR